MPGVRNTRHGDQILPTMILRYRHFAHHRIVSNRVSPRLLAQPWRHPIRSIVHTAPLNPRRR